MDFTFGSRATRIDPLSCLIGFLVGYLLSHGFNGVINLALLYMICVLVTRSVLSFFINLIDVNDYIAFTQISRNNDTYAKKHVDSVLSIEYNVWSNVVTVSRDMKTVICTDKDIIKFLCKKYFNVFLCWDIFYHAVPLRIVFK